MTHDNDMEQTLVYTGFIQQSPSWIYLYIAYGYFGARMAKLSSWDRM